MRRRLRRAIRAVRIAATDSRIPRPLRWLAALGLAPIPGPVDEVILVVVAVPLALFYRGPLAEAWALSAIDTVRLGVGTTGGRSRSRSAWIRTTRDENIRS